MNFKKLFVGLAVLATSLVAQVNSAHAQEIIFPPTFTELNETVPFVDIVFSGLQPNKDYDLCVLSDPHHCESITHNRIIVNDAWARKDVRSDAENKISVRVCGDGQDAVKINQDCGPDDYFHGGHTYRIRLYPEGSNSEVQTAAFKVKHEYLSINVTVTSSGTFTPSDQTFVDASGRRPGPDDRNNYQAVMKTQTGGGFKQERCFTIPETGSTRVSFPPVEAGTYVIDINEKVDEHSISGDTRECSGGFTYKRFVVKIDPAGGQVLPPTNDPNKEDASNLISGQNPCQNNVCDTAVGDIPTDPAGFIKRFLTISLGVAGGIALILMSIGAIRVITSSGDQQKLTAGKDMFVAAIAGLIFLILSVLILRFIGSSILGPTLGF
ncbi:MAG: pilin [Candidatus Curtissbacteria bacterium]|nr:pilin [Candidatus Curtissbacteria bacterium]